MAAYNGPRDKAPKDYSPEQLFAFKMNRRDQTPAPASGTLASMKSLRGAIEHARDMQLVLTIDPKQPADAVQHELEIILAKALNYALDLGALANVVLKTDKPHSEFIYNAAPHLTHSWASRGQSRGTHTATTRAHRLGLQSEG